MLYFHRLRLFYAHMLLSKLYFPVLFHRLVIVYAHIQCIVQDVCNHCTCWMNKMMLLGRNAVGHSRNAIVYIRRANIQIYTAYTARDNTAGFT